MRIIKIADAKFDLGNVPNIAAKQVAKMIVDSAQNGIIKVPTYLGTISINEMMKQAPCMSIPWIADKFKIGINDTIKSLDINLKCQKNPKDKY